MAPRSSLLVPVQHIAWIRDRSMGFALTIMSPHIASQLPSILLTSVHLLSQAQPAPQGRGTTRQHTADNGSDSQGAVVRFEQRLKCAATCMCCVDGDALHSHSSAMPSMRALPQQALHQSGLNTAVGTLD